MPSKAAGSLEQPGEINLAQFKSSGLTDSLEPAVPSRLRSKPVVWPGRSVSLEASLDHAK